MNKKIENLIIKFLLKEANTGELRTLEIWMTNPVNENLFYDYIKINASIYVSKRNYDLKTAKKNIVKGIDKASTEPKSKIKYVAVVAVLMLVTTFVFKRAVLKNLIFNNQSLMSSHIIHGTDKAILTLQDGTNIELDKGNAYRDKNAISDGEKIIYKNKKSKISSVKYNYLTVPRGGQYYVVLSDSTQVWLNSESQLRYPVNFIEGKAREVELVYGEAYFDVSPSSEHSGSKFKVLNQSQEVCVLGTKFNIKAYKDETVVSTTLIEGKVNVRFKTQELELIPDQRLEYDVDKQTFSVSKVDVYNEISWKEGVFNFHKMELEKIMTVLSRWYDFEVVFEKKELKNVKFNGTLGKEQSIEEILNAIINFKIIDAYEINEKTIVLR